MRLLIIESRTAFAGNLKAYFVANGIVAERTDTGKEALELVRHYDFDLLILSSTLIDTTDTAVLRHIRAAGRTTPVLVLLSMRSSRDRVQALAAGADDVVDQNVDPVELLARTRAIVRRSHGHSQSTLQIGAVALNLEMQSAIANGAILALTAKEIAVLHALMIRKNMVMTKKAILAQIYGGLNEPEPRIIDTFICKIRSKLAALGVDDFVDTIWGRGYMVRDQEGHLGAPATPTVLIPTEAPRRFVYT